MCNRALPTQSVMPGSDCGVMMPIYEYLCRSCGDRFELLVRSGLTPACTSCESSDVERLLSVSMVHSEITRGLSLRAAKKRDAGRAEERVQEQIRYEQNHEGH